MARLRAIDFPITRRCDQRWVDLAGSGTTRHCVRCDAPVTNLSAMGADEAKRWLAANPGPRCLAYRYRPDGAIVFARDVVRPRDVRAAAAVAAIVTGCAAEPVVDRSAAVDAGRTHVAIVAPPPPLTSPPAPQASSPIAPADPPDDSLAEQPPDIAIDCRTLRQLEALGAYGMVLPERCR